MIEIIHQYRPLPCPAKLLRETAAAVYSGENIGKNEAVTLILCSDYMIRKLNRQYRKIDRATDVLSFPFGDPDLLGEIYISLQRAKIQAKRYGLTYNEELKRLLIHGLLHLIGYDHHKKPDKEAMEAKEQYYNRSILK
jgi:probable rRNA maturation factor